jgi:hypothetical protein
VQTTSLPVATNAVAVPVLPQSMLLAIAGSRVSVKVVSLPPSLLTSTLPETR